MREALRSRVFWIVVTVLFISSIATERCDHAHGVAADGPWRVRRRRRARPLRHGRREPFGRLLTGWLLDRFFAVARVVRAARGGRARHVRCFPALHSLAAGVVAAGLIGLGMGGEADVTPYLLSRYFGLRSFSVLYGLTWTFYAIAGAIGPVLMGKAFDLTGSYEALLLRLSIGTFAVGSLMLVLPRYRAIPFPSTHS